jgi:predicted ATP-grasp superfamily ATP-dependent carboligase
VPVKRELSVLGLCIDGKVMCPGLIEATSGGQGARRGVAATGVSSSAAGSEVISEDLMEKLRTFMKSTGYNGLFDIDLVETEDGSQYFLEVNLRYGASGYVLTCEGVNLPGIYADHMLKGVSVPDEEEITGIFSEGKKTSFVSEKVLMENYAEGAVTDEEFEAAIGAAEISFVRDDEDKRPYATYLRAFEKIKRDSKL